MTKDEVLKKHEDDNEYHFHQVDREWIMEAMQEYTEQQLRLHAVVKQSELLSKRPNTSSTWECFTKAEKQQKGNV